MPPQEYWSHVPAATLPHLHFYNIPVTIDATHADNPFNIIKAVYRPGDFVVRGAWGVCNSCVWPPTVPLTVCPGVVLVA